MIRFDNIREQAAALRPELDAALCRVLDSGRLILGEEVSAFERQLASYVGVNYAVGLANGTESIALALMAQGVGRGDQVILPAMTAFPTVTGVLQAGAEPVAADILPRTGLLDPADVPKRITNRTRAILAVHLYGQSADMDALQAVADDHGLKIIEDCAQAIGAMYRGRSCGSMGVCGAFSFYPTKNLGGYGDGGAVTTNDEATYRFLLKLRNYGQSDRYHHDSFGINSRLDEIQAAFLSAKLPYLDGWTKRRRYLAALYRSLMPNVSFMVEEPYGEAVYHIFALRHARRDDLMDYLRTEGVQTLIHYPVPVHCQPSFPGRRVRLEAAEKFAEEVCSIPLYPELSEADQSKVAGLISNF